MTDSLAQPDIEQLRLIALYFHQLHNQLFAALKFVGQREVRTVFVFLDSLHDLNAKMFDLLVVGFGYSLLMIDRSTVSNVLNGMHFG